MSLQVSKDVPSAGSANAKAAHNEECQAANDDSDDSPSREFDRIGGKLLASFLELGASVRGVESAEELDVRVALLRSVLSDKVTIVVEAVHASKESVSSDEVELAAADGVSVGLEGTYACCCIWAGLDDDVEWVKRKLAAAVI